MDFEPSDFIEEAARTEVWDEDRWHEWQVLQGKLIALRVSKLELREGAMLIAYTKPLRNFEDSHVMVEPREGMLNAVSRLVHRLSPEPPGTHHPETSVGLT